MKQAKTPVAVTHTHTHTQAFYRSENVLANYTLKLGGVSFCTVSFENLISNIQDSFVKCVIFA